MSLSFRISAATVFALAAAFTQAQAGALSTTLRSVGDLPAGTRPAGVPTDYLITPNGFFHPSCVVQIDEGDQVTRSGAIRHADGTMREVAPCRHDSFASNGQRRAIDEPPQATFNGWVAYSHSDYNVTPPAMGMRANWTVPASPTNVQGQTLYYFPGLEQAPNVISILQPVLGWDGYGQSVWTMANWNCCISGTTYSGPPIAVNPGDKLLGGMLGSQCSSSTGICPTWKILSRDLTTGQSTVFTTDAHGQAFNWYFGGVMEVYGVFTCNQYPANGKLDYTHVKVEDLSSTIQAPVWQTTVTSSAPPCNYVVNATTNETVITFSTN
jgi:hypothetical protein